MSKRSHSPLLTRRFVLFSSCILLTLFVANVAVLNSSYGIAVLSQEWLPTVPGLEEQRIGCHVWRKSREPCAHVEVEDEHPIKELMRRADEDFEKYNTGRSKTFRESVDRYRRENGRHPPPGFKEVHCRLTMFA